MSASKLAVVLFGLFELAFPRKVVELGERAAFENPGVSELRSWTIPVARAEGVASLALVLCGDRSNFEVAPLLGLIGVPALFVPRRFVDASMRISYRDSAAIELKSWVVPFTRLLGLVYVLVAVREFAERRSTR
jgi:hypothetical protein